MLLSSLTIAHLIHESTQWYPRDIGSLFGERLQKKDSGFILINSNYRTNGKTLSRFKFISFGKSGGC
jgi:hypothetical protein